MNKLIIATLAVLLTTLTGCGNSDAGPVALDGVWQSVEKPEIPTRMSAIIADGEMKISFVEDDGITMLYWLGTAPETIDSGDIFVSQADTEALAVSLLGSSLESKEFKYEDGELSFEQGLMGAEWVTVMRKVD